MSDSPDKVETSDPNSDPLPEVETTGKTSLEGGDCAAPAVAGITKRNTLAGKLFISSMRLDKSFELWTPFEAPEKLGYFSVHVGLDGKTEVYHPDMSSLKYFHHDRSERINLLEGYSSVNLLGRVPPGQIHILRWVVDNMNLIENKDHDFICHSRALRSIMATPFILKDNWTLVAVKVRGAIILNEIDTEDRYFVVANQIEERNKGSYAGYKFIEKLTRYQDGSQAPTYAAGNRDSFYTVTKSKVGKHNLLYSNRIDCVTSEAEIEKPFETMNFALIKSRGANWNVSKNTRRRFWQGRVIGWWTEATCAGITQIHCGDKKANYLVDNVTKIPVFSLPQNNNGWSPKTCVQFLEKTLDFIKEMVTEELTVYTIHCDPNISITCRVIDEPVDQHIPSWYINGQSP